MTAASLATLEQDRGRSAEVRTLPRAQTQVLIVTALLWQTTAHFARECIAAGISPAVLAPADHPLHQIEGTAARLKLPAIGRTAAIEQALVSLRPELLIPADDHVVSCLHAIYRRSNDAAVRALIERSLGDPRFHAVLYDRMAINRMAARMGLIVPRAMEVPRRAALTAALESVGMPAYLKLDGTWGGFGTARVTKADEALRIHAALHRDCDPWRALAYGLRHRKPLLPVRTLGRATHKCSVQAEVKGTLVIASATCWQGTILAFAAGRVVKHRYALGPAETVTMEHDPALFEQAQRLVRELRFSGMCGFDFIADEQGTLHFIEFNPRLTPLGRVATLAGGDQIHALFSAALGTGHLREGALPDRAMLAL